MQPPQVVDFGLAWRPGGWGKRRSGSRTRAHTHASMHAQQIHVHMCWHGAISKTKRARHAHRGRAPECSWLCTYTCPPQKVLGPLRSPKSLTARAPAGGGLAAGWAKWLHSRETCLKVSKTKDQKSPATDLVQSFLKPRPREQSARRACRQDRLSSKGAGFVGTSRVSSNKEH